MTGQEIWDKLYPYKIKSYRDFIKEFIFVTKDDFDSLSITLPYQRHYKNYISYRSEHWFKHLHLKEYNNIVDCHFDHGNFYKIPSLIILHFILDIIPYLLFKATRPPLDNHNKD